MSNDDLNLADSKNDDGCQNNSVSDSISTGQNNIVANTPHTPTNQIVCGRLVPPPLVRALGDLTPRIDQNDHVPVATPNNLSPIRSRGNRDVNRVLSFETTEAIPTPGREFLILAKRAKMPSCSFLTWFKHFRDDHNYDHDSNEPGIGVLKKHRKKR